MQQLIEKIKEQFTRMCNTGKLFRVDISGREIYQMYLMSFPDNTDPIFRDPSSSTHNCNNCKSFINRYGNIVAYDAKGNLMTMFDIIGEIDHPYNIVAKEVRDFIKSYQVKSVFFESYDNLDRLLNYEKCNKNQAIFKLGYINNHKQYSKEEAEKYGVVKAGEIRQFNHFNAELPKQFIIFGNTSIESVVGKYNDKYSVFKRAILEITLESLLLVEDLINQGSLLDGTSHLHSVKEFIDFKNAYIPIAFSMSRDGWLWQTTYNMEERTAKFGNTLVGTLCYELSEGKELNAAVQSWNKRVDPINYMKAKAPITANQIKEAQKFVEENGYIESFNRRLATIDDISVSEIKHIANVEKKAVTIFDTIKSTKPTTTDLKQFDNVEEVSIEKFMSEILPKCTSVEALFLNNHEGNLVTLTTANIPDSKPIFKWDNNYSWNFNGNLAGKSQIKDSVKEKGGKIDGVLRFSIGWGEGTRDNTDLDAHAWEPNNTHIYFGSFKGKGFAPSTGNLDVDVTQPNAQNNKNVVENITWSDKSKMQDGTYRLITHCYGERGNQGFTAEVEFDGIIHTFNYNKRMPTGTQIEVAKVTLNKGVFTIVPSIPMETTMNSKTIWNLETNKFHKVNLVCLSPNHWGNNQVGNKHYFFMLDNCKTDKDVRGFHNENLLTELQQHRKVLEVLANSSTIKINNDTPQISGIGFNSTVKDEVILKLSGSFKRMIKVKF